MKPLVNYCRWNNARLRLHGRDKDHVWGELAFEHDRSGSRSQAFRYDLNRLVLTLIEDAEAGTSLQLDEMGVVVSSSAGDAPR